MYNPFLYQVGTMFYLSCFFSGPLLEEEAKFGEVGGLFLHSLFSAGKKATNGRVEDGDCKSEDDELILLFTYQRVATPYPQSTVLTNTGYICPSQTA